MAQSNAFSQTYANYIAEKCCFLHIKNVFVYNSPFFIALADVMANIKCTILRCLFVFLRHFGAKVPVFCVVVPDFCAMVP